MDYIGRALSCQCGRKMPKVDNYGKTYSNIGEIQEAIQRENEQRNRDLQQRRTSPQAVNSVRVDSPGGTRAPHVHGKDDRFGLGRTTTGRSAIGREVGDLTGRSGSARRVAASGHAVRAVHGMGTMARPI